MIVLFASLIENLSNIVMRKDRTISYDMYNSMFLWNLYQ